MLLCTFSAVSVNNSWKSWQSYNEIMDRPPTCKYAWSQDGKQEIYFEWPKQNGVTLEVFVLWLCNQHYYTCDVIGIKMTYRDLLYYEYIRAKTCREYKLQENKHKNHTNHLHTLRKWSITWLQFVLSTRSKCWLICHSMECTAIYSSHDSDLIKYGGSSQDYRKPVAFLCRFISSRPLLLQ